MEKGVVNFCRNKYTASSLDRVIERKKTMEFMLEHEIRMRELKSTLINHARNIKNKTSFEEDLKSN